VVVSRESKLIEEVGFCVLIVEGQSPLGEDVQIVNSATFQMRTTLTRLVTGKASQGARIITTHFVLTLERPGGLGRKLTIEARGL